MKTINRNDWQCFFPFNSIRDEQEKAIDFILNSFLNEKKKFCICDLGTGVGKSAIAVTVARYMNDKFSLEPFNDAYTSGSYLLTTQKILQEQYVHDFGSGSLNVLSSIKSSTNYTCNFYKDQSCSESRMLLKQFPDQLSGTEFYQSCKFNCVYACDKRAFLESPIGTTNFSYFLAETKHGFQVKPRRLLVIDECHTVENEIGKFIEVTFSEKFANDVLKCKLLKLDRNDDARALQVHSWIENSYLRALSKYLSGMSKAIKNFAGTDVTSFSTYSKRYDMLEKHKNKVLDFIKNFDDQNWILNVVEPQKFDKRSFRKFEFKPVNVSAFAKDTLYKSGEYILMMSATVIDKKVFTKSIGIDDKDAAYFYMPSPFPTENRQVHYAPVGKMSMKSIDQTLPKLANAVKFIIDQHENEKGIIHTGTFRAAQFLYANVDSSRFLIHDSYNREKVLKEHISGKNSTILLSPSMMEGIDLSDDSSRFQILCKIPFPYLGDKVVKKRMTIDPQWYQLQTIKSIVQAMGRSVRNSQDYAISYILDEDWQYFFNRNKHMFPRDFISCLK